MSNDAPQPFTREEQELWKKRFETLPVEDLAALLFEDFEVWARRFAKFKGIDGMPKKGLEPNILQLRVIEHYRKCQLEGRPCLIMILKPRQKGASTIAEAICYHHMRRHPNLNGALMGDVQSTSDKVFEMFRRYAQADEFPYADGQPNFAPGGDMADEITLSNGSKWWKETAGSSNAGRSGTVQVLHLDEVAYFPASETKDPTTAVLGAFYKEGPHSLGFATSTAKGASGWFHDTWWAENDWHKVFAAWYEFPDAATPFRDDDERRNFERSMTADEILEQKLYRVSLEQLNWRRKKIRNDYKGDIGKFRQEYPSSAQGAFLSSSRMRFDEEALADMLEFAKRSEQDRQTGNLILQEGRKVTIWIPDARGSISRWEEPRIGCRYLVSIDTCTGEDQQIGGTTPDPDWHSIQVHRAPYVDAAGTLIRQAIVAHHRSRLDTDVLAEIAAALAFYYGNCLVVPEVNNSGLHIVKLLVNKYGCNVFRREAHVARKKQESEQDKLEAFGWQTDKLTKKWIIDEWAPRLRNQEVMIYDPLIVEEHRSFIIKDNGLCEAAPSKHDDTVMAACIGNYCLSGATEYRAGAVRGIDLSRMRRDPRYMAPDGFRRKVTG